MRGRYIVGIDEAGRGPLAGPVTVAALAAPISKSKFLISKQFKGIKDSKKLSLKKREEWFLKIKNHPHFTYKTASVGSSVIDRVGISRAAKIAINRCLKRLNYGFKFQASSFKLLLDGSLYAPPEYRQRTIIKGDEKISIIAAASIIAKVTRDRKMVRLAKRYPSYSFEIHKGYGTKLHCKLVKKYGLCDIHRRSFCSRLV